MAIYVYTDEFIREPGENTVAYRPLTSTQQTDDLSGNGHTLTLKDMYSYNTYLGVDSLEINGSSSTGDHGVYTQLADSELTNSFTISAYMDGCCVGNLYNNGQRNGIAFKGNSSFTDYKIETELNNGSIYHDSTTETFQNGQWLHLVLTYNNGDYKIYVNGTFKKGGNHTRGAGRDYMGIGVYWGNNSTYVYPGHISNVIIESKARTDQEISDYFNGTKSNYGIQ